MSKPVRRLAGLWVGTVVSAILTALGVVVLRHALETPQPLKNQLPGESLLYRWRRRSIFYKVLGAADAPPLVLLHSPGIGASSREMQHIMPPLALTYRVYVPDLLGFGLSDRPGEEYSAVLYTALCRDFLRDVVQRPATLLAAGLSCNYVVAAAFSTPDLCTSLVLISPTELEGSRQMFPLRKYAEVPLIKALLYPLLSTHLGFLAMRGHQRNGPADFTRFYQDTHQFGAEHAVMALLAGKLTENVLPQFKALSQPMLVIWGTRALENTRLPAGLSSIAAPSGPAYRGRTVELVQDAGFAVHEEQPESVVAAIRRWQAETNVALPARAETEALPTEAFNQLTEQKKEALSQTAGQGEPAMLAREVPLPETAETSTLEQGKRQENRPAASEAAAPAVVAYCVKCKQKREMLNPQRVTMKNGRPAMRGTCPICGTGLNRIGG